MGVQPRRALAPPPWFWPLPPISFLDFTFIPPAELHVPRNTIPTFLSNKRFILCYPMHEEKQLVGFSKYYHKEDKCVLS